MSEEKKVKENDDVEDLDDELEKQFALQDQIHHKCKTIRMSSKMNWIKNMDNHPKISVNINK